MGILMYMSKKIISLVFGISWATRARDPVDYDDGLDEKMKISKHAGFPHVHNPEHDKIDLGIMDWGDYYNDLSILGGTKDAQTYLDDPKTQGYRLERPHIATELYKEAGNLAKGLEWKGKEQQTIKKSLQDWQNKPLSGFGQGQKGDNKLVLNYPHDYTDADIEDIGDGMLIQFPWGPSNEPYDPYLADVDKIIAKWDKKHEKPSEKSN